MNKNVYKKLGKNIKGLNFVGKIEIAFSKPSFDTIIDIANALEIKLNDLFNFDK